MPRPGVMFLTVYLTYLLDLRRGGSLEERVVSSWRVGDVVPFEQMRQLSDVVVARIVLSDRARALAVRRDTLSTDGYDRAAVDARSRELAEILREVLA